MKTLKSLILFSLLILVGTACKKSDSEPVPEPEPDFVQVDQYTKKYKNGVVEVSFLPIDTTRKTIDMYDYYNFESSKMVAADQVLTDKWDVAFYGRYSSALHNNNSQATKNGLPWKNPNGNVKVSYINLLKNFDEVNGVTSDLTFLSLTSTGGALALGSVSEAYHINESNVWCYSVVNPEVGDFIYSKPYKNRTTIFKLNNGTYVKFQFINNYNTKPDENSEKSKRGFLSFRYFVAKTGSTDLKTK